MLSSIQNQLIVFCAVRSPGRGSGFDLSELKATARSAMVTSSVSPGDEDITVVYP